MDTSRFDRFTRVITAAPSRRTVLQGLVVAVLGLAQGLPPSAVHAKKRKPKVQLNAFGCVNVGGKCRGKDAHCCSGICQGAKPRKGEQDKSRCVTHDVRGCTVERRACIAGTPLSFCSDTANCMVTTGNATFCAEGVVGSAIEDVCRPCRKDTDCEALGFGEGAACVIFRTEGLCGASCEDIEGNVGTACFPPGG